MVGYDYNDILAKQTSSEFDYFKEIDLYEINKSGKIVNEQSDQA